MSIMATETQHITTYVHHMQYTTQHVLRVFIEDVLDYDAPSFGTHLARLRRKFEQLKKLQIHVYDHRLTVTWWAPQGLYRPRHLNTHEAHTLVAQGVVEMLANLQGWPVPPYIVQVDDLVNLLEIERDKHVDWGLGGKKA